MQRGFPGCGDSTGDYRIGSMHVRRLREEMIEMICKTLDNHGIPAATVDAVCMDTNAKFAKVLGQEVYK